MSQEVSDIFSKVNPTERQRLFKDLANKRGELICKGEREEIYRLVLEATSGNQELRCTVVFGFNTPQFEKEILANFFIGGERYFFKSAVKVANDIVFLRMDIDLYHLQRRQNYRIKIPESYQAHLLISQLNKAPAKLEAQLRDLSTGGCRAALTAATPVLEPGDRIEGYIVVGKKESIEIEGTIRHHKLEKTTHPTKQVFGIEFKPLTSLLEGKLFALTMDLHREFFSHLKD